MGKDNQISQLKREILTNIIKAFDTEDFAEYTRDIPYVMRPKGAEVPFRCCIYKERAILKDRAIAGLGFAIEEDDEITSLATYAKRAVKRQKPDEKVLTVLQAACKGCVPSRVHVTDLCQGCVARNCVESCNFDAIKIVEGKAVIDPAKCKNCLRCVSACPYGAITKVRVPCEDVCPVGAIKKDEYGLAQINFDTCISCGKCVGACPFGAIHEKSQIVDILLKIKQGKKVYALLAPSIVGQFAASRTVTLPSGSSREAFTVGEVTSLTEKVMPSGAAPLHTRLTHSIGKIKCGLKKAGFSDVYEVAYGADITTRHEGEDFRERMGKGDKFMTTSCCSAYNELVAKHIPGMKPFVASSKTPAHYIAEVAKKENPDCVTVFVSPCISKKKEALQDKSIDYVLNFEEVSDLFDAREIDVESCADEKFEHESSRQGRLFPVTGGVAKAVCDYLKNTASCDHEDDEDNVDCGMDSYVGGGGLPNDPATVRPKPYIIGELSRATIKELEKFAKAGVCEHGNMIEVMSCAGGCAGGNATLKTPNATKKFIEEYSGESFEIK